MTHQTCCIFREIIVQRFGSNYPEQEDHTMGTLLGIQLYHRSVIFTVTHWLDSYGREHLGTFCLKKERMGVFFL